MSSSYYLPVMLDMRHKRVLVVGGGAIACEKLSRLVECSDDITIVATECTSEMEEYVEKYGFAIRRRPYREDDLEGFDIVIAAVDSLELQSQIFAQAEARRLLCNAVDLPGYCHFIFPSIIRRDDLIIAISTSGASPAAAKHLKRFFAALIPENIGEFLSMMREKRNSLPKGKERMRHLDQLASQYIHTVAEYASKALKAISSKS